MRPTFYFIARLRHWQMFIVLGLPFLAIVFLVIPEPTAGIDVEAQVDYFFRLMLWCAPLFVALYIWIWAAAIVCNAYQDEASRRSTIVLDFGMPFVIAYLIFAIWAWPKVVLADDPILPVGPVMTLHVIATLLLFYTIYFAARSVGSVGRDRSAGFGRTVLFFLAFIYFPIGLWAIQPVLNRASAEEKNL